MGRFRREGGGNGQPRWPGTAALHTAVSAVRRRLPGPTTLRNDGVAGVTVAVASVPSGMANGLLAGVNPIYGLYANVVAPVVGGLLSSSRLMVINSTAAVALVAGQALLNHSPENRDSALFLMVILTGIIAAALGLLRLGRLVRFVSLSVMTGFLAGIAIVLVISQLPTIFGIGTTDGGAVRQVVDLVRNIDQLHLPSLALGLLTLALAFGLRGVPRVGKLSSLIAVVVPTALAFVLSLDDVATVSEVGEIVGGVPLPQLPSLGDVSVEVVTGAFSVAIIAVLQGVGVSQAAPNPDGSRANASRDFGAQGAANVAAGVFSGLPVGGSLGGTAINVVAGARHRWAAIISGLTMVIIVVALPGLISVVIMPALGALLVVAVLFLPIQVAVAIGVALSFLVYVSHAASNVVLVELVQRSDQRIEERPASRQLPDRRITVLDVYGSLFFASADRLEQLLPATDGSQHPAVILRLRGKGPLEATITRVLSDYADKVVAAHGRLYLVGLGKAERQHLFNSGTFNNSTAVQLHEATPVLGESLQAAYDDAQQWLESLHDEDPDQPD